RDSLHPRFRDIDPTFTGPDFELAERVRLARAFELELHADDYVAGLRWALRKYDLRAVAHDAKVDVRTLRAFVSGERTPKASTLEKIGGELWASYGERAESSKRMRMLIESCYLNPYDPLCRALIEIDDALDKRERDLVDEL